MQRGRSCKIRADKDALITTREREAYTLWNRTPGLTQAEIAAKMCITQPMVNKLIKSATRKINELKNALRECDGNPELLDQYLITGLRSVA